MPNTRTRTTSRLRPLAAVVVALLTLSLLSAPADAEPQWKDPSVVGALGTVYGSVSSDADALGNAVAAWATASAIVVVRRPAGGTWGAPEVLHTTPVQADPPRVHVHPDGRTVVVWTNHYPSGTGGLFARTTRPGQGWGPVLRLEASQSGRMDSVMTTDGSVHVTWQDYAYVSSVILTTGDQWAQRTAHAMPGCGMGLPSTMAAEADGSVTMLSSGWRMADPQNPTDQQWWCLYVQRWTPAGGWGAQRVLDPNGAGVDDGVVATGPNGTAHVVWSSTTGLKYAERNAAGEWSGPTTLRSDPGQAAPFIADPQVVVDAHGGTTVAWTEGSGTSRTVRARTRLPGSTWGPFQNLSTLSNSSVPELSTDAAGGVYATWLRVEGTSTSVDLATRNGTSSWNAATSLGGGALPPNGHAIAYLYPDDLPRPNPTATPDGTGNILLAWPRDQGAPANVVVLRTLDGAGPQFTSVSVPERAAPGALLALTAQAQDAWSGVAGLAWDFGDGATATGTSVNHTYASEGTYTLTLTATDTLGNTSTTTRALTVAKEASATITKFTVKPKRIRTRGPAKRRNAKAVLELSAASPVTIVWKKKVVKKKKGKRRTVLRTVAKAQYSLKAGRNQVRISAKVGRKKLKPGKYVLVATTATSTRKAKLRIIR